MTTIVFWSQSSLQISSGFKWWRWKRTWCFQMSGSVSPLPPPGREPQRASSKAWKDISTLRSRPSEAEAEFGSAAAAAAASPCWVAWSPRAGAAPCGSECCSAAAALRPPPPPLRWQQQPFLLPSVRHFQKGNGEVGSQTSDSGMDQKENFTRLSAFFTWKVTRFSPSSPASSSELSWSDTAFKDLTWELKTDEYKMVEVKNRRCERWRDSYFLLVVLHHGSVLLCPLLVDGEKLRKTVDGSCERDSWGWRWVGSERSSPLFSAPPRVRYAPSSRPGCCLGIPRTDDQKKRKWEWLNRSSFSFFFKCTTLCKMTASIDFLLQISGSFVAEAFKQQRCAFVVWKSQAWALGHQPLGRWNEAPLDSSRQANRFHT